MSNFNEVNSWVNTLLKTCDSDYSNVTKSELDKLEKWVEAEEERFKRFAEASLKTQTGEMALDIMSELKNPDYDSQASDRTQNGVAIVSLNRDRWSTDGLFTIFLIMPKYYVFKIIIRVDNKYKVKGINLTFKNYFKGSYFLKPFVIITNSYGEQRDKLFEFKDKVDASQSLEQKLPDADKEPFHITTPDGKKHYV